MEEERREHVSRMKKMEQEMEQVFEMKVREKLQKLRDSEAEVKWYVVSCVLFDNKSLVNLCLTLLSLQLQRRHEQMKKNLEAQHKEIEEKRRQHEEEMASWEAQQRILEQQKLDASR